MDVHGVVGNADITILHDSDYHQCYLQIRLVDPDILIIDDEFPNARMLSATLVSWLGFGPASEFLQTHNVPKSSELWHLNYDGEEIIKKARHTN